MSHRELNEAIGRLGRIASGDVAWEPLRDSLPSLRDRVERLRDQAGALPAPLAVLLFGGTGAGKSTLLNALAGAEIAETGPRRPTTSEPTVYLPVGAEHGFGPARYVESPYLEGLILIDTPDVDSVVAEHAARVEALLKQVDVVLFCASQQKYKDDRGMALLRPLRDERKVICVQTRADEDEDIRTDWKARLESEGFDIDRCYLVSARNALRRKAGGDMAGEAFEFDRLETFLRDQLPPQREAIKTHNLFGAVLNTVDALENRIEGRARDLQELDQRLADTERAVAAEALEVLQARLVEESHVWVAALGDAVSERCFGLIGLLYRLLHGLRMLPSRAIGKLSFAGLLGPAPGSTGAIDEAAPTDASLARLAERFHGRHADVCAYLARTGFPTPRFDAWREAFARELDDRLRDYLQPVRERTQRRARRLARWLLPLLDLAWFAPFVFTVSMPIYHYYWNLVRHGDVVLPEAGFLERSAAMLGVVILLELTAFAVVVRLAAYQLRNRSRRELAKGLEGRAFGFAHERAQVQAAMGQIEELNALRQAVEDAGRRP